MGRFAQIVKFGYPLNLRDHASPGKRTNGLKLDAKHFDPARLIPDERSLPPDNRRPVVWIKVGAGFVKAGIRHPRISSGMPYVFIRGGKAEGMHRPDSKRIDAR